MYMGMHYAYRCICYVRPLHCWSLIYIVLVIFRCARYVHAFTPDIYTNIIYIYLLKGVPRKPGMTRDDLFNTNAGIVKGK